MARSHWARWLPQQYAAISDPDSYFSEIGQEAARQIDELTTELAGDGLPGEDYLARAGRLAAARSQAEEIVTRARRVAEEQEYEAIEEARQRREQLLEQTKREIELETRRAIAEIRDEVTNLTILATEKVTRKTLTSEDQRRLVEEALGELDFSALASEN